MGDVCFENVTLNDVLCCVCVTYMFIVGSYINRNKVCANACRAESIWVCEYKIVGRVAVRMGVEWDVEMETWSHL